MENFEAFAEIIKKRILDFMPEEYRTASVEIKHVFKNNDEERNGISIRKEEWATAPVLYLEGYYQMLWEGNTETEILERIARDYSDHDRGVPQDIEELIPDFETAKERLWIRLAGKESNQKRLEEYIYKEVEGTDLVATFQLCVNIPGQKKGNISVDKQILKKWGCSVDSLYEAALDNMVHRIPAQVMELESVLTGKDAPKKPEEVSCQSNGLYILRNAGEKYGAAALLYPGVLQALAENSGADLFLLPSSIHEMLVVKVDGMEAKELQRIVIEVNRNELKREDILSNQVYRYDAKTQSLLYATTKEETQELLGELSAWGMYGEPVTQEQFGEEMER